MISAESAFATASRSEPAPESAVEVTMIVAAFVKVDGLRMKAKVKSRNRCLVALLSGLEWKQLSLILLKI